jgi:hypothetical protein
MVSCDLSLQHESKFYVWREAKYPKTWFERKFSDVKPAGFYDKREDSMIPAEMVPHYKIEGHKIYWKANICIKFCDGEYETIRFDSDKEAINAFEELSKIKSTLFYATEKSRS